MGSHLDKYGNPLKIGDWVAYDGEVATALPITFFGRIRGFKGNTSVEVFNGLKSTWGLRNVLSMRKLTESEIAWLIIST